MTTLVFHRPQAIHISSYQSFSIEIEGKLNYTALSAEPNTLTDDSMQVKNRVGLHMRSHVTNASHTTYLIPESISELLHPRVRGRLVSSAVSKDCLFDVMRIKHGSASLKWAQKRYVVFQCSGGCGGFGDRMKGIFSVLFHAIAIGYEFRIAWDSPVKLNPDILVPSAWLNWTQGRTEWWGKGHRLKFMDKGAKPYGLCAWRSHQILNIKTNGHPIPQDCDFVAPKISEILLNQSSTQSCIRTASNRWKGGTQCMGCTWWYLFQIGRKLEKNVVSEMNKLGIWRKRRDLENALSMGLHVRAGDSNMKAGRGREGNVDALVRRMELCASNFSKSFASQYYAVVVSDSTYVKRRMGTWPWLHVYVLHTTPFHIDKGKRNSKEEMMIAVLSVLVDLLVLSFQDALLLSGTSGFGFLAQGVGMFDGNNVVQCVPK